MKDKLELFFDIDKLKDAPACPDLTWDRRDLMDEEIVKVRKSDLQALIDANVEAYNILDEIRLEADRVSEKVSEAHKRLEDVPNNIDDLIVEEEEKEPENAN